MTTDIGVQPTNLIGFMITPSRHRYTAPQARQYFLELQNHLSRLPGVTSASAAEIPILAGDHETNTVHVEGHRSKSGEDMNPLFNAVLPGFFQTMGIPLIAGRDFTPRDTFGAPRVVIVNQEFVKRYVRTGNPLCLHLGRLGSGAMDYQIVRVVKNSKQSDLREQAKPYTYISMLQSRRRASRSDLLYPHRAEPNRSNPRHRKNCRSARFFYPRLQIQKYGGTNRRDTNHGPPFRLALHIVRRRRNAARYHPIVWPDGFAVTRRKFEIGIRVALGARRDQVLQLMMKEVWLLGLAGVTSGLLLAAYLARFVQSQLYGVKARDPLVMVLAGAGIFLLFA